MSKHGDSGRTTRKSSSASSGCAASNSGGSSTGPTQNNFSGGWDLESDSSEEDCDDPERKVMQLTLHNRQLKEEILDLQWQLKRSRAGRASGPQTESAPCSDESKVRFELLRNCNLAVVATFGDRPC